MAVTSHLMMYYGWLVLLHTLNATALWTRRTPLGTDVHALNVLKRQNRGGLGGINKERQLGVDGMTHAKVLLQERLALLSDTCMILSAVLKILLF